LLSGKATRTGIEIATHDIVVNVALIQRSSLLKGVPLACHSPVQDRFFLISRRVHTLLLLLLLLLLFFVKFDSLADASSSLRLSSGLRILQCEGHWGKVLVSLSSPKPFATTVLGNWHKQI
jgi:hypothetical protein